MNDTTPNEDFVQVLIRCEWYSAETLNKAVKEWLDTIPQS